MGADIAPVQVAFPGDLVFSHILLKPLPPPYSGPAPLLRYLPYILYLVYPWCHCMHTRYLLRARPLSFMFIEIWGHLWCQPWGLLGGQSGHKVVMGLVFGSVVRSVMGSFIKGSGLYISCMSQICPVV